MIQQPVHTHKKMATASLDDCSIPEMCYKLSTLIVVVKFWYVWYVCHIWCFLHHLLFYDHAGNEVFGWRDPYPAWIWLFLGLACSTMHGKWI